MEHATHSWIWFTPHVSLGQQAAQAVGSVLSVLKATCAGLRRLELAVTQHAVGDEAPTVQ